MIKLIFFMMLSNPILGFKSLKSSNILEGLYSESMNLRSLNTSNVVESSAPLLDTINSTLSNITNISSLLLNNTNQTITIDEGYVMPPVTIVLITLGGLVLTILGKKMGSEYLHNKRMLQQKKEEIDKQINEYENKNNENPRENPKEDIPDTVNEDEIEVYDV